jgi:hypothetical protein
MNRTPHALCGRVQADPLPQHGKERSGLSLATGLVQVMGQIGRRARAA